MVEVAPGATPAPPTVPASDPKKPKWPIILAVVAGVLLLAGLGLKLVEPDPPPAGIGAMGAGLTDGNGAEESPWAPGFLKMGFSFFVCFAMGYAARKFLKVALIASGVIFALLYGASYMGWLEVKWDVMGTAFDEMVANLKNQFDSMKGFVTGSLPAAGMGAVGLFAGFKAG